RLGVHDADRAHSDGRDLCHPGEAAGGGAVNVSRDPARDRKALIALGIAVLLFVVFRFLPSGNDSVPKVVAQNASIDDLELRLRRLRLSMARVPGKEAVLKEAASELAGRERGLIVADTVNQAQAQVLDAVKTLAHKEGF